MGTKSADNIRNVWPNQQAKWIAEGRRLEREEAQRLEIVKDYSEKLSEKIMLALACTPMDQWPSLAKSAHEFQKREMETSAYFYEQHNLETNARLAKKVG
jgi:hypothetical protein